tara:strand:+ start:901 stop:3405 length:2505 start_codon:yes stop_codon:yes gene_type:complete
LLTIRLLFNFCVIVVTASEVCSDACAADSKQYAEFFEAKIRPVLLTHCYECHHGKDAKSGFRIDRLSSILKGGERGPALIPRKAKESLLLKLVTEKPDSDLRMPPNGRLTETQIADLTTWIDQGAFWPDDEARSEVLLGKGAESHWAFQPFLKYNPKIEKQHPIDFFAHRKQRQVGTAPLGKADPATLLRRLYIDLIGLPPTFDEIEEFRSDASSKAYELIVEKLLNSPRHGERWGRHWMDVVRYADTAGDNADYPIPEIHLYRNYIIDSLNNDKPFDRFVREQIAGDILTKDKFDERYAEQVIATGFVGLTRRYGTIEYQHQHLIVEDSIEATGRAFLAMSFRCARCHDHKFDPVTTRDYYGLYGIFASTQYPFAGAEVFSSLRTPRLNFISLATSKEGIKKAADFRQSVVHLRQEIAGLRTGPMGLKLAGIGDEITKLDAQIKSGEFSGIEFTRLQKAIAEKTQKRKEISDAIIAKEEALRKSLPRSDLPPDLPSAYAVTEGSPFNCPIHKGGQPTQPGEVVPRGLPSFLSGGEPIAISGTQSGRLQLARWLTNTDLRSGRLLARVICNRVWLHHFGEGIVRTPNNFGLNGAKPTHPELIDFLAQHLIANEWSLKSIHRLIVTSRTYQLASRSSRENEVIDPENKSLWKYARRRLSAEAIRDRIMFVSGTLNLNRPGMHPFPPIESWKYTQHNPFQEFYPSPHRSIYLMTQRFKRHPYLGIFDQPDANTSTGRRSRATVPQQSLYLMNHPFMDQQAKAFADRLEKSFAKGASLNRKIDQAVQLAFGRGATDREIELGQRHFAALIKVDKDPSNDWTSLAKVLLMSNEMLFVE